MSGTRIGAAKAKATLIAKYGEDWYKTIGRRGGAVPSTGGFASSKVGADGLTGVERAKVAGSIGGSISTRLGIKNGEGKTKRSKDKVNGTGTTTGIKGATATTREDNKPEQAHECADDTSRVQDTKRTCKRKGFFSFFLPHSSDDD